MKNFIRAIQTHFPALHDARFRWKFSISKLFKNPHEVDFKALTLFNPKPSDLFLDVGSNRGEAILSMLIAPNFQNKIIGFEPNSLIFNKLQDYYKGEGRVELHNIGLGSEKGNFDLFVPFYRRWMFDGLSSFKKSEATGWLATRLWNYNERKLSVKKVRCEVLTLDSFNYKPYFVKIDVQGFEIQVLKGAKNTIKKYEPILLIESIDEESKEFLKAFNYDFYNYHDGSLRKGEGELNTFCITSNRFTELNQ